MPRRNRQSVACQAALKGLTINDYANNKNPQQRLRKIHQSKKNLNTSTLTAQNADEDASVHDDDDENVDMPPIPSKSLPCESYINDREHHQYAIYHDDVWFAIGKHVAASDVGRFALINKQTANICRSASFWRHIYRRVCRTSATQTSTMPERLQPDCMVRLGGLRTCTIRALFYCDPVLSARMLQPSKTSVFDLVRRECVGAWSIEAESSCSWWHCYRLKRRLPANTPMADSRAIQNRSNFLRKYRDIFQNADESCALLVVRIPTMRPLPKLFGQASYLNEVRHNLCGHGCAEYRLSVTFVRGGRDTQLDDLVEIVYNPVTEMRVLDWWMPEYHEFVRKGG